MVAEIEEAFEAFERVGPPRIFGAACSVVERCGQVSRRALGGVRHERTWPRPIEEQLRDIVTESLASKFVFQF